MGGEDVDADGSREQQERGQQRYVAHRRKQVVKREPFANAHPDHEHGNYRQRDRDAAMLGHGDDAGDEYKDHGDVGDDVPCLAEREEQGKHEYDEQEQREEGGHPSRAEPCHAGSVTSRYRVKPSVSVR